MKKKKLFSLVLATVLTAATVLPCYGASTKEKISNAQAEQAAAQSQLDSIQSRIDELNSKKGQSEEYLSELNQQLDDLQNRLQELQDQYDAKQNELVQIQADLEDAKAKEEEQYEAMKLRIQYMYENSSRKRIHGNALFFQKHFRADQPGRIHTENFRFRPRSYAGV